MQGWRLGQLANAHGLASLDLDSAGFVATRAYGGFPWSIDAYMDLAEAFPFRRVASLDYCTEHEIAGDREEVLDRVSRTIRANRDCLAQAATRGLLDRFMPVIQGRRREDYERCVDALWPVMVPGAVIGVGSMCRREIAGPEGVVAIFEHLDRILPSTVRLHGFGVKGSALPYLTPLAPRIASIDSQAFGGSARREALRRGISKTDALVADHLERWLCVQHARLREPAAPLRRTEADAAPAASNDPWEIAIAAARSEIRAQIEDGDLEHDEITAGWIEQWAAEIYHRQCRRAA